MQERRKLEMQQAAEAEAASKIRASLLRSNIRKANQKVLLEAERLKAEGKATREAASQALLAAIRCQLPPGHHQNLVVTENLSGSCSASCDVSTCADVMSSDAISGQRDNTASEVDHVLQELETAGRRLTADDILMRQGRGSPSPVHKVCSAYHFFENSYALKQHLHVAHALDFHASV